MNMSDMMHHNTILEIEGLTKIYGHGHTAVKAISDVSLHVEKGEIAMIMGPSGSGKTTLLSIAGALLRPSSGKVRLAGIELTTLSSNALSKLRRSTLGFIFQSNNLLTSLTAGQNVELGLNLAGMTGNRAKNKAHEMLDTLGLSEKYNHGVTDLSGGEQQRVAIARALANKPGIVLADEPTANLDSKNGYFVVEMLRTLSREQHTSIIIVTHDARIKNLADRVLWLEDGHLNLQWSASDAAIDPVCLMVVDSESSATRSVYQDRTYYFCTKECRSRFEAEPERYHFGR